MTKPKPIIEDFAQRKVREYEETKAKLEAARAMLAALEVALAYAQNIAGTSPTEYNRMVRQRQACKDVATIKAAIAAAKAAGIEAERVSSYGHDSDGTRVKT